MMAASRAKENHIRIGVDLGGTKIEFVALERDGTELHRHRIPTPRFDYEATVRAVAEIFLRTRWSGAAGTRNGSEKMAEFERLEWYQVRGDE